MSQIERLLLSGKSARDETVESVTPSELRELEKSLNWSLPPSYIEFVALDGLAELRIHHRVLNPEEISANLRHVDSTRYIPFADSECGDFYCWIRSDAEEPAVVFADHETGEYVADAESFEKWLENNRF